MARLAILKHLERKIMTETEFLQHSAAMFAHIEDALDADNCDIDCQFSGNVLTLETTNGTQIVINRHTPNHELWLATKSGGYHFAEHDGRWLATRDGREFFDVLNEALSAACGETVKLDKFQAA